MSFLFSGHNRIHSYNIHRASHYRGKESGGASGLLLHPEDKLLLLAAGSLTRTRPALAAGQLRARLRLAASPSVCACSQRARRADEVVPVGTWLLLSLLQRACVPSPRAGISSSAVCPLQWKLVANQCHRGVTRAIVMASSGEGQGEKQTLGISIPTCRLPGIRKTASLLHPARSGDEVATAGSKCHGRCVGTGTTCPPALAGEPSPGRTAAGQQNHGSQLLCKPSLLAAAATSQTPAVTMHPTACPTALWAQRWLHSPAFGLTATLIERCHHRGIHLRVTPQPPAASARVPLL